MRDAFSLLELILSLIILAIVFLASSKYHLDQSRDYLNYFEKLYILQDQLYIDAHKRDIKLYVHGLNTLEFKEKFVYDDLFELKKLHIQDQNYNIYFHNE